MAPFDLCRDCFREYMPRYKAEMRAIKARRHAKQNTLLDVREGVIATMPRATLEAPALTAGPAGHLTEAQKDRLVELYLQTPAPTNALCDAFHVPPPTLYELVQARGGTKRSQQPGYDQNTAREAARAGRLAGDAATLEFFWIPRDDWHASSSDREQQTLLDDLEAKQAPSTRTHRLRSELSGAERDELVGLYMADPKLAPAELLRTYNLDATQFYDLLREAGISRGVQTLPDGTTRKRGEIPPMSPPIESATSNGQVHEAPVETVPQAPAVQAPAYAWRIEYVVRRSRNLPAQTFDEAIRAIRAEAGEDVDIYSVVRL